MPLRRAALPAVVLLFAAVAGGAAGADVDFSGSWELDAVRGTPWPDGGTLTISPGSASDVPSSTGQPAWDAYVKGYCTGPPPPGGTAPNVRAWYKLTYTWSGGGRMGGCVSDKTNGQLIFFGEGTMGHVLGRSGDEISGDWTDNPNGSSPFTAKLGTGLPPGGGDSTGCAALAHAAGCELPFGKTASLPVPKPNRSADISSARLPAGTREVDGDAEVTDAEIDEFLAALTLAKRVRGIHEMCVFFSIGGELRDVPLDDTRAARTAINACAILVARLLEGSPKTARASQAGRCVATFVPLWEKGVHPTPRRRRAAVAVYRKLVTARCSSRRRGQLSIKVAAKRTRPPLNRLLGRRARARVGRTVSGEATDGADAKMTVRWRRRR